MVISEDSSVNQNKVGTLGNDRIWGRERTRMLSSKHGLFCCLTMHVRVCFQAKTPFQSMFVQWNRAKRRTKPFSRHQCFSPPARACFP